MSLRDESSALAPTVSTPLSSAACTASTIMSITPAWSTLPRNLPSIIWSEVEIETLRCLTPVFSIAFVTSPTTPRHQPSRIRSPIAPSSANSRLASHIVLFVPDERKAKLGLVDAHLTQVVVDHRPLKLGHLDAGGLYAVSIGHVDKVNLCHTVLPFRLCAYGSQDIRGPTETKKPLSQSSLLG